MADDTRANSFISIKGTREGLRFILNDDCSYRELLGELKETLQDYKKPSEKSQTLEVILDTGYRCLKETQEEELREIFLSEMNVLIKEINSMVMTNEEAKNKYVNRSLTRVVQIVRSGQEIVVEGDLLLIGDVNPNGVVKATGNIYVIGALRGVAHAGIKGREDSIISAGKMEAIQLRIGSVLFPPEDETEKLNQANCFAYVNAERIIDFTQISFLNKIRPKLYHYLT